MSHKITTILSRKMIVALVCLLLVGGFATVAFAYTQANSADASGVLLPPPSASCPRTVSYGSSGEQVKTLQKMLNSRYKAGMFKASPNKFHYPLAVDGSFGPQTQAAVKDYQKAQNLHVDGVVGPHTWYKMGYIHCSSGK
jgi:peptidoglycan hydrolase-like protein with peptidoglycan-binding domain